METSRSKKKVLSQIEWVKFRKPIRIPPLLRGTEGVVIELDGESHDGRFLYDMERQRVLESMGLTLLRFSDSDVKKDISSVLMAIEGWIEKIEQPPLTPFIKGELPT